MFLKIKIENFYLQKQLRSDRFSLGTPFFRRKKQCVVSRKFVMHPKKMKRAIEVFRFVRSRFFSKKIIALTDYCTGVLKMTNSAF